MNMKQRWYVSLVYKHCPLCQHNPCTMTWQPSQNLTVLLFNTAKWCMAKGSPGRRAWVKGAHEDRGRVGGEGRRHRNTALSVTNLNNIILILVKILTWLIQLMISLSVLNPIIIWGLPVLVPVSNVSVPVSQNARADCQESATPELGHPKAESCQMGIALLWG